MSSMGGVTLLSARDPHPPQPFRPSLELTFRGHRGGVLAATFQSSPTISGGAPGGASAGVSAGELPPVVSAGSDGCVFLWSSKVTGRALRLTGHRGPVHDCTTAPRSQLLASAGHDGYIRLWLPRLRRTHNNNNNNNNMNMNSNSVSYTGGAGENCSFWRAHAGPVRAIAASPHDDLLYTAGDDKSVKCWDLNVVSNSSNGKASGNKFVCGFTGGHQNWVRTVAVSSGSSAHGSNGSINTISGTGDGLFISRVPLIASGGDDRTVQVWDPRSRRPTHTFFEHTNSVRSVDFHPDGCSLATGSSDHTINVFDLRRNRLLQHYEAHDGSVNEVRFAPTGSWLLSASSDGAVKLWDLKEGYLYCTLNAHEGAVQTARFSDNGAYFTTAGQDGIVMVWRSGLPNLFPSSYSAYPQTQFNNTKDGHQRALLSDKEKKLEKREEIEKEKLLNTAVPLKQSSKINLTPSPNNSPRINGVRNKISNTEETLNTQTDSSRFIEKSINRQSNFPQDILKSGIIDREEKIKENKQVSLTSSKSCIALQKPPLAQPSSRTSGGPSTMVYSCQIQDNDKIKKEELSGKSHLLLNYISTEEENKKPLTFGREKEEEERRYPLSRKLQIPEKEELEYDRDGENENNIDRRKEKEIKYHQQQKQQQQQGGHYQLHDINVASIESVEYNDNNDEIGRVDEIDEEMSVVEYVGNTYESVEGEFFSSRTAVPSQRFIPSMHNKEFNPHQLNDRLNRLEEAYSRLSHEVQKSHEQNIDIVQQLQQQWDLNQRQQRSEMDQLRQMMEGLVAQQTALLQALRKE